MRVGMCWLPSPWIKRDEIHNRTDPRRAFIHGMVGRVDLNREAVRIKTVAGPRLTAIVEKTGEEIHVRPERLIFSSELEATFHRFCHPPERSKPGVRAFFDAILGLHLTNAFALGLDDEGNNHHEVVMALAWRESVRAAMLRERAEKHRADERTVSLGSDEMQRVFAHLGLDDLQASATVCASWRDEAAAVAASQEWQLQMLTPRDCLKLITGQTKLRWPQIITGRLTKADALPTLLGLDASARQALVSRYIHARLDASAAGLTLDELILLGAEEDALLCRLRRAPTEGVMLPVVERSGRPALPASARGADMPAVRLAGCEGEDGTFSVFMAGVDIGHVDAIFKPWLYEGPACLLYKDLGETSGETACIHGILAMRKGAHAATMRKQQLLPGRHSVLRQAIPHTVANVRGVLSLAASRLAERHARRARTSGGTVGAPSLGDGPSLDAELHEPVDGVDSDSTVIRPAVV